MIFINIINTIFDKIQVFFLNSFKLGNMIHITNKHKRHFLTIVNYCYV